jgi:hypothetical protein
VQPLLGTFSLKNWTYFFLILISIACAASSIFYTDVLLGITLGLLTTYVAVFLTFMWMMRFFHAMLREV